MPVLPQPGDHYADFVLIDVLGVGAFAIVYKAVQKGSTDHVALKLSKEAIASEAAAIRALREVEILDRLTNEHVVRILDHGLGPDDRWYLVMELLRGQDLGTLHAFEHAMPVEQAISIVYQACLGLSEAHRTGIVHRDIKPRNLWVEPNGNVKVLDFGLARSWDRDSIISANATGGHMLVGTPHYAQPEQVESGKLTPASDVYSLAFLLYELLTGYTPLFPDEPCNQVRTRLAHDPLQWLAAHVDAPVIPLERYPAGAALPRDLRHVLHQSLAKHPAQRPGTAGEFATHLAWFLPPARGGWMGGQGLVLQETPAVGCARRFFLSAGSHRIGIGGCCEIELASDRLGWVYAIVYAEPGGPTRLRPVRNDGFVRLNGTPVHSEVWLEPGATLTFGRHQLAVLQSMG